MNASLLTRVAVSVLVLWTVLCLGTIVWGFAMNPMRAREKALDARLNGMVSFADELPEPEDTPFQDLRAKITGKKTMWKELVGAPVAAPKPVADPNLKEKLKGVSATRQQIAKPDGTYVRLHMGPQDKNGTWKKVGDTVNGLTIREITPKALIFATKQGGKEYTVELPRR